MEIVTLDIKDLKEYIRKKQEIAHIKKMARKKRAMERAKQREMVN